MCKWSRYKVERQRSYPRRSHGHDEWKSWSNACREKSADAIVPKARVPTGKGRIEQCQSKWLLPCESFVVRCPKGTLYPDDRTESDNRIEAMSLEGIAENNLPHIVRWESSKPPYAERHVRWCERSVNTKVGDKCLWLVFTSYSIIKNLSLFLAQVSLSSVILTVHCFCAPFQILSDGAEQTFYLFHNT